jgi:hypothetical protein
MSFLGKKLVNPLTGRSISLYGPTHMKLMDSGIMNEDGIVIKDPESESRRPRSPSPQRSTSSGTIINPLTGYTIKRGGATHNYLMSNGMVDEQGYLIGTPAESQIGIRSPLHRSRSPSPVVPITPEHDTRHLHEEGPFCGPAGGLSAHSYPVDTPGRARAAIGRSPNAARHGGDPEAIKQCACEQAEKKGWFSCHSTYRSGPAGRYSPQYPK